MKQISNSNNVPTEIYFAVSIDYPKGSYAKNILQGLTHATSSLEALNTALFQNLSIKVEKHFILYSVEKGSIQVWFQEMLGIAAQMIAIPADLQALSTYLTLARKNFLTKGSVKNTKDVEDIANKTNEIRIDQLSNIEPGTIIANNVNINNFYNPMKEWKKAEENFPQDSRIYISNKKDGNYDVTTSIDAKVNDIFSNDEKETTCTKRLRIRKLYFEGNSKWEFKSEEDQTIHASISDQEWLKSFQNREISLKPGDILVAKAVVTYDAESQKKKILQYNILRVLGVHRPDERQRSFQ